MHFWQVVNNLWPFNAKTWHEFIGDMIVIVILCLFAYAACSPRRKG